MVSLSSNNGGNSEQTVLGERTLPRTRLIEQLMAARDARVVLLEAPAGYSKTTTLRLWEAADRRPFVWVHCEERLNDPALLVSNVIQALGSTDIGPEAIEELESPVPDLGLLLDRIGEALTTAGSFVLAIDDAHLLQSDGAWQVLYSLIAALPATSQMAVASRSHPGLPLGRLRARGELCELGMGDLALTRRESRELLAGLDLDLGGRADEIHERAEGWPVAMYLAGLAIRQGSNPELDAATFSGGDRVVVEYFRDEFLREMPEDDARFLCRTSILVELNGPLCDAVTGGSGSLGRLNRLARENALVVPLDRENTRFRYHHLFRDMLRSELNRREVEAVPELNHRAAVWLAGNGDILSATDYAISSGDFGLAGTYVWLDFPDITGRGRIATLDRWFNAIGDERVARIPSLILSRAHREIAMGCGDEAFYWLSVAEREIGEDSPLYGDLFALRATLGPNGPAGMIEDGRQAARHIDPASPWQVPAKLYEGIGLFLIEDKSAVPLLREAAREAVLVSPIIQVMALVQLALEAVERGRFEEALDHATRARDRVEECGLRILRVMSLIYAVLALVKAKGGLIEQASAELDTSRQIGAGMRDFIGWHEAELVTSRCRTLIKMGQFERATEELHRAEAVVERMPGSTRLERWISESRSEMKRSREVGNGHGLNLTRAEIRTLKFLPSHHSFRAIGEQLFLSQNTVKTQANSLYRKLGVNSRAEAVMEGRRLGLLDGDFE